MTRFIVLLYYNVSSPHTRKSPGVPPQPIMTTTHTIYVLSLPWSCSACFQLRALRFRFAPSGTANGDTQFATTNDRECVPLSGVALYWSLFLFLGQLTVIPFFVGLLHCKVIDGKGVRSSV
ncbi:Hypothetical protein, putative [Bodo saltans]|uniref:Transmembrane protein n=1 Tax=Bodo saltans TaxID=75058 RepID=A0A0S4J6J8_BODSA|nr:Hypothetical protein, putative [Bodo saltans]|eukprot:CUG87044.1 Hypothetical protein, putative [Bodo saltans]